MSTSEGKEIQKTSCGISLRGNLLLWGYFRLLYNIFLIFNELLMCALMEELGVWFVTAIAVVLLLFKVACLVCTLLLIIAAHKKSHRLLSVFYRWEKKSAAAIYISLIISYYLFSKMDRVGFARFLNLIGLVYFGIQLHVILIARSEIFMMGRKQELVGNSTTDTDTKCEE